MNAEESMILHDAICFAARAHHGQKRKGCDIDYIAHPCEVLQILTLYGAELPLLLAGVLHDTVEDTEVTMEDIRTRYGEQVAALVAYHTEDKSKTWEERKTECISHAAAADPTQRLLIAADKLSNLRSMAADYGEVGEELWSRFKADKQHQAWYYGELIAAMAQLQADPHTCELYWEMVCHYKTLFTQYYIADEVIYETDGNTVCALRRDFPQWQVLNARFDFTGFERISCSTAEELEELWYNEWVAPK